jgi:dipeptidyl aminopeptidase/acylaminoacyl peptidase
MAEPARRAMVPQDLTRIRFVSDPRISPDGRRVAFVVTTLSEERDECLSSIWVVDVAGGEPRRFTAGPRRDTAPRWSPDGGRLAFLSEREPGEKPQLHVMPADGGESMRLTDLKNGVGTPEWSPDGTHLAFASRVGGWQEPEGEEERRKSRPARVITTLKYRLNGEGFTYDRRAHVFVVPAAGGEPRQVTDGDFEDADPVWSPDGRWIAFASARHAGRDRDDVSDIWLVAPDIHTPLLILHSEDDLRCPIEQAEQLFVALKTLGREVLFVRFPDETHELSRSGKPRHRLERFRIILDWFGARL